MSGHAGLSVAEARGLAVAEQSGERTFRIEGLEMVERRVGRQWLITSPDVVGLYVAHVDLDAARRAVPDAIDLLRTMAEWAREPSVAV